MPARRRGWIDTLGALCAVFARDLTPHELARILRDLPDAETLERQVRRRLLVSNLARSNQGHFQLDPPSLT